MITPDEITKSAARHYRVFLKDWVKGEAEGFFPRQIRANLKRNKEDMAGNIQAINLLREKSKEKRGWGYRVHWEPVRSTSMGKNFCPKRIEIETLDDLLRLARPEHPFSTTLETVTRIREKLPELASWLVKNVHTVAKHFKHLDGLISVTKFFLENPFPDCYARQIPVAVHTKFVEDNKAVLGQWLDIVLPASAIEVNETTFAGRFGLRDNQLHHALRVLDPHLLSELQLSFNELSLPSCALAKLPVRDKTVVIVENKLPLLTLPPLSRTMAIFGEGKAVTFLHKIEWLHKNRVVYWGDIDVDGFQILSSLRNLFPHVVSIMMDRHTLEVQSEHIGDGEGRTIAEPSNLTREEAATFQICLQKDWRLEQERIAQSYVDTAFNSACPHALVRDT